MRRSPLIILFITIVIDLLGFGMVLPLQALYIDRFGGTPLIAGLMSTSYSIMQFLWAPIWGRVSDLRGRRPMILMSLIGSALSFTAFGAARTLWMLFVARVFTGILTAASLPAAHAYIADVTPPEKRSRGMALIGVAFGIGFAVGPILGGWLGRTYGLSVPAYTVAVLALLNFAWSLFALPESRDPSKVSEHRPLAVLSPARLGKALAMPALGNLLTIFGISTFAFAFMESTFTWLILFRFVEPFAGPGVSHAVVERDAAALAGSVFMVVGITMMIAQGAVMGGMAQRMGERHFVRFGSLLLTISLAGIAVVQTMPMLKLLAAGLAVGSAMLGPVLSSLISKAAPDDERGEVHGVQQGLASMARMIAPPTGTFLLQRFGTASPYITAAAIMAVAAGLSMMLARNAPPSPELGPEPAA